MKHLKLFLGMALATTLSVSCNNDDELSSNKEVAAPNEQSFKNLREKAIANLTQTAEFQVDGVGNITFTSKKGVEVIIPESCLNIDGQSVTGKVKLDFVELYDKSDILATNIATMGVDYDGQQKLLVTGGAFNINLSQDGKKIDTYCNYTMVVPANNTDGLKQEMDLWYGTINEDGDLAWNLFNCYPEVVIIDEPRSLGGKVAYNNELCSNIQKQNESYQLSLNQFGWINCDYFYSDPRDKTSVSVKLPDGYGDKNSEVFIAYKGVRGIMRVYPDLSQKLFVSDNNPIGIEAYIIVTSESNGKWAYSIKTITVEKNQVVEVSKSDLKEATGEEFDEALKRTIN